MFLIEYWVPTHFTMSMANWARRSKLFVSSPKGYVPNASGSSQLNCPAQHNKPWFLHPHLGPISNEAEAKANNNSILDYWTQALNTIPDRLPKCRLQNENQSRTKTNREIKFKNNNKKTSALKTLQIIPNMNSLILAAKQTNKIAL